MDGTAIPNPYELKDEDRTFTKPAVISAAALCLAILAATFAKLWLTLIAGTAALLLGIYAIKKKKNGKGFAAAGIVLSVPCILLSACLLIILHLYADYLKVIFNDYETIYAERETVFAAYEIDATIPQYLQKYREEPYSELLDFFQISIYDVMDGLYAHYKQDMLPEIHLNLKSGTLTLPAFPFIA